MDAAKELKYVREELKRTTLKLEWYRQEATVTAQKLEAIRQLVEQGSFLDLENEIILKIIIMKDTYWLEKRIEGLEKHIENLYEVIEEISNHYA